MLARRPSLAPCAVRATTTFGARDRCVERRSNSGWRRGCWRSRSCYKVMYYARRGAVQYTSAATPARMYPDKGGPPASQRLRLSIRQHAAASHFSWPTIDVQRVIVLLEDEDFLAGIAGDLVLLVARFPPESSLNCNLVARRHATMIDASLFANYVGASCREAPRQRCSSSSPPGREGAVGRGVTSSTDTCRTGI
eukprot:COSAG01_NODE_1192_length_11309_cov_8.575609_9_plen_195_part_00